MGGYDPVWGVGILCVLFRRYGKLVYFLLVDML